MNSTSSARSEAEAAGGIAGAAVGFGAVTVALFPFSIPFLILLAASAVPLVALAVAGALLGAVVAVPWLAVRGLVRALRRPATPHRLAAGPVTNRAP